MVIKSIAAGKFKQTCLALLDSVANHRMQVLVTKRGRPVARLVPIETDEEIEQVALAELCGKGRMLVDEETFLAPTDDLAGWKT
ncbi:MAG: type II toxin-antitoxin system prevent-host-death family antitoxin [Deltaproteobacteria bacterium]|nr:type II toxin-antitoxin system prevent-host-death family antitoxin [Deltaproteobacteria bacterium]